MAALLGPARASPDIPVMTWTPRSDWLDVKSAPFGAVGDGVADDTAAIQAALTLAGTAHSPTSTVFLPAGTYKITRTLDWQGANPSWAHGVTGCGLIGCGRNTILKWAGAPGAAMFWTKGARIARYMGLAWDGANLASCAYEASSPMVYEYSCRHENESFRNFTAPGTYLAGRTLPPAAIIAGLALEHNSPDAEIMIWNCLFVNCTNALIIGHEQANNYMWEIKGCEFEACGTGILNEMGKFTLLDSHFQGSTVADISCNPSHAPRIRRCTSAGSRMFYYAASSRAVGGQLIQDCWIDSWTNPDGAIQTGSIGPSEILDCTFTNPPAADAKNPARSPIVMTNAAKYPARLTISDNSCPTLSTKDLVNPGPNPPGNILIIPAGAVPANTSLFGSASFTFLHTAEQDDRTQVIDVTQPPYRADKTGAADATAALQQAIDDAARAHDGPVVYLPAGRYKVSRTLIATGANYTIQGAGVDSVLSWVGADGATCLEVRAPQHLSFEQLQFIFDVHRYKDIVAIRETSTVPCQANYDGIYQNTVGPHAYDASGLVLDSLPAGSRVTAGHLVVPLRVHDCGEAKILINYSIGGRVVIDGAEHPKTGFLGIINTENGTLTPDPAMWDFCIDDNQDLVVGDYYQEQGHNVIRLARGTGTGTGHVTITGIKENYAATGSWDAVRIDNYSGRFFYGQTLFANSVPTHFTQSGANACALILDCVSFYGTAPPVFALGAGANLVQMNNVLAAQPARLLPNVLPDGWSAAAAQALDDERLLGQYDLGWNYGLASGTLTSTKDARETP
jgi:hypothetical protein